MRTFLSLILIPCAFAFAFAPLVVHHDTKVIINSSKTKTTTQLCAEAPSITRRQAATEALLRMTGFALVVTTTAHTTQPALALNSQPADNEIVKE